MPPENLERLATACLVVDALGKKVRGVAAWGGGGAALPVLSECL